VSLRISDGRRVARRGQRLRWRVELRHVGGGDAEGLVARVDLPRAIARVRAPGSSLRGRRLTYRVARLGPGQRRRFTITATVRRRVRARAVLLAGVLAARDDADPRDNRARDRTVLGRRRARSRSRSRAASIAALAGTERARVTPAARNRAAADHRLARRNGSLRRTRGPRLSARTTRAVRSAYGYVCRLLSAERL
jgi:hypothetical protein